MFANKKNKIAIKSAQTLISLFSNRGNKATTKKKTEKTNPKPFSDPILISIFWLFSDKVTKRWYSKTIITINWYESHFDI